MHKCTMGTEGRSSLNKLLLFWSFCVSSGLIGKVAGHGDNITEMLSFRQKRGLPLIFPITSPTRTQWIVGIGIPLTDLRFEALTTGYVIKAEYFLPDSADQLRIKRPYPITVRKFPKFEQHLTSEEDFVRNIPRPSITKRLSSYRWSVYKGLEGMAHSLGLPGRACMLKSICEAAEMPFAYENGLLGELLHILLTPSSSTDELSISSDNEYYYAESLGRFGLKCDEIFRNCDKSLLNYLTDIDVLSKKINNMFG